MKRMIVVLLLNIVNTFVFAQTNKARHCPSIDQIIITQLKTPYSYRYTAFNQDDNYFISDISTGDQYNSSSPVLMFDRNHTSYDPRHRILSCVYYAYTQNENNRPTLVNIGNY